MTRPRTRGVIVFTEETADEFPSGDSWVCEEQYLRVYDREKREIATYKSSQWLRVEAGRLRSAKPGEE